MNAKQKAQILLIAFGFSKISEDKKTLYSQSEYFIKCSRRESVS
jgi:hypothetical protein